MTNENNNNNTNDKRLWESKAKIKQKAQKTILTSCINFDSFDGASPCTSQGHYSFYVLVFPMLFLLVQEVVHHWSTHAVQDENHLPP